MKKVIIILALSLLSIGLSAAIVSENEAKSYANKFFSNGKEAKTVMSSELLFGTKAALTAPAYFVFNNPDGGWVIISGEDAVNPVIAYSNTGSFKANGMPSNLKYWMSGIRDNINSARKDNLKRSETVERAWQCIGERTKSGDTKTITTALWSQEDPYNQLCPKNSGESYRSVTGCVATAMAIMMRHYQWPTKGTGTLASYKTETYNTSISSINISNQTYNYSDMPMTDGSSTSWTSAQKTAVATLMYHCGVMVQMDYTYGEGSAAYSADVIPAVSAHMGYSKNAVELYRYMMPLGDWFFKIKGAIDAGNVLMYGGSGDDGGHQFICDGYDVDNAKIHINWGWGGQDNGFFTLDLSIPSSYAFDYYQSCMFDLVPDKSGTSTAADVIIELGDAEDYGGEYKGIELASGTIAKGSTVKFNVGSILNYTNDAYSGKIKLALVGFDGTIKQTIGSETTFSLSSMTLVDKSFQGTITSDLAPGDFFAMFYTKKDGSWTYMPWDSEGGTIQGAYGVSDARIIRVKNSYSAGDRFNLDLMSITPGQKLTKSVSWSVNGTVTTRPFIILSAGTTTIKATITYSDGSTETVSAKIVI